MRSQPDIPQERGWHIIAEALRACTLLVAIAAGPAAHAQADPARLAYDREDYAAADALYRRVRIRETPKRSTAWG